eukprot:SAG22_NODE_553_length_9168_cov_5.758628_1_plen_106_part_00
MMSPESYGSTPGLVSGRIMPVAVTGGDCARAARAASAVGRGHRIVLQDRSDEWGATLEQFVLQSGGQAAKKPVSALDQWFSPKEMKDSRDLEYSLMLDLGTSFAY